MLIWIRGWQETSLYRCIDEKRKRVFLVCSEHQETFLIDSKKENAKLFTFLNQWHVRKGPSLRDKIAYVSSPVIFFIISLLCYFQPSPQNVWESSKYISSMSEKYLYEAMHDEEQFQNYSGSRLRTREQFSMKVHLRT